MKKLADIMDHHAELGLACHFQVYREGEVLLEWHDAFSQPILLTGTFSEDQVAALAERFGTSYSSMIDRHQ